MQPALVCSPPDSSFSCASGWRPWKHAEACHPALFGLTSCHTPVAISLHQNLGRVAAVPCEPSAAQGLQAPTAEHILSAGGDGCAKSDLQGMTGLVTKHSNPGSQVKGPVETEETLSKETQLVLSQFQGSVEVDSIDGVAFFSFTSAEDLREFARSMDQLREEQYREPHSPDGSAPSSVARSGVAEDDWREPDWAEERQSLVVLPRKTTDITKIKGWRRKAFGSDQMADQTTRWVMDQINEKAWHPEETPEPPSSLMTRQAAASLAAAGQHSDSDKVAAPPLATPKRENLPVAATEASLSKGVRGAFLSSSLDEFLEHRAELRVGQLAQLNPNILPPPDGQGVLSLSSPPVVEEAKRVPRQVGPARQMTARPSRRYGRPQAVPDRDASLAGPSSLVAKRRRQSAAATPPLPSPSPPLVVEDSPPKPAAKRLRSEPEEEAPFLAMTSRKLRGSQGASEPPESRGASTSSTPKKDTVGQASKPSGVAASKKSAAPSTSEKKVLDYGVSADAEDYPLVTETVLTNEQRRLLQALIVSTQSNLPIQAAQSVQPGFVCPQLDQEDALAAALALGTGDGGGTGGKPMASPGKSKASPQKPANSPGKPASSPGKPASSLVKPASSSGKPAATSGKPAATSGKPAATSGKPAATSGKPVATSGKPVATSGKPAATSGKPVAASEKPVAISGKPAASSLKQRAASTAHLEEAVQSQTAGAPKGAQKVAASTTESSLKGSSPIEAPQTPRKTKARLAAAGTLASPTEATQSTRTRREIRLPARFQDSALYFSPNGDLYDPAPSTSSWQRGRPLAIASTSKAPQASRPPPMPTVQTQAPTVPSGSSSPTSWDSSSSSSCSSSPSSSRSSSPCDSCCRDSADTSQASRSSHVKFTGSSQAAHMNGGRTLRQLSRLKTDGFVSLNSISNSQASTTPEGSIDIDVESVSVSDEDSLSMGEEPHMKKADKKHQKKASRERVRRKQLLTLFMELQSLVFRSPGSKPIAKVTILAQADQYLRCLRLLSEHLSEEKDWQQRRRAALQKCLEVSLQSQQPPQLPRPEPKVPPLPASIGEVVDLSQPSVPPLREASEESTCVPSSAQFAAMFGSVKREVGDHSCSKKKKRHATKDKEIHGAKSGKKHSSKHRPKAETPQKVGEHSVARPPSAARVEAAKNEEPVLAEVAAGNGEVTQLAYTLNGGHIGALRSIPTPSNVPKKYTLYPTSGTALTDLSKLAEAAQHIIGPCIIKRVKLRSGQTVYVYREPNADGSSTVPEGTSGCAVEDDIQAPLSQYRIEYEKELPQTAAACASELQQPTCQDDEISEVMCDYESQDSLSQGHEGGVQQDNDNDDAVLQDTSEWISGDGDTCIIMKIPVCSDEEEGGNSSASES